MREVLETVSAVWARYTGIAIAIVMCSALVFGQAQSAAADLSGTVVDPNGAVVPGATVTARNLATNISRSTTTGTDGTYSFIALPPGEYEITTEAATFKKVAISPIRLTVGQSAELKISLEIGAADADRLDADQNLVGLWHGIRLVAEDEAVGTGIDQGLHAATLLIWR